MSFEPSFTVTHAITADLTRIERARGFLEAATLPEDWIREMSARALILAAHHTTHMTHIEGTRLTLEESEVLLASEAVPEADPDDVRELLNYRDAFEIRLHVAGQRWAGHGRAGPGDPQTPRRGRPGRVGRAGRVPAHPELRGERLHQGGRVQPAAGARRADPHAGAGGLTEPGA